MGLLKLQVILHLIKLAIAPAAAIFKPTIAAPIAIAFLIFSPIKSNLLIAFAFWNFSDEFIRLKYYLLEFLVMFLVKENHQIIIKLLPIAPNGTRN